MSMTRKNFTDLLHLSYFDQHLRELMSYKISKTSFDIFVTIPYIKFIEDFDRIYTQCFDEWIHHQEDDINVAFAPLASLLSQTGSPLLTVIQVVACYENFFKAELLSQNFLIHQIESKKPYSKFSELQREKPITIKEIVSPKTLSAEDDKHFKIKGLRQETIGITTLLKPDYQKILSFQQEVYDFLLDLKTERNTLHCLVSKPAFKIKQELVDNYKLLKDIAITSIKGHLERLAKSIIPHQKDLIDTYPQVKQLISG